MASLMPCSRSCALRASSLPTNSAILPPCGSASLIKSPGLPAGRDVVGADVALALAVGRVAVVREHERLSAPRRSASLSDWPDPPG